MLEGVIVKILHKPYPNPLFCRGDGDRYNCAAMGVRGEGRAKAERECLPHSLIQPALTEHPLCAKCWHPGSLAHPEVVAWPSGLRRWIKAPVSSGAWVRVPPLYLYFIIGGSTPVPSFSG